MKRAILAAVLLCGGCSSPHYCDLCKQIREIQAKSTRIGADMVRLEQLKKDYARDVSSLEAYRGAAGNAVDLHPDCDCPCHTYALMRR